MKNRLLMLVALVLSTGVAALSAQGPGAVVRGRNAEIAAAIKKGDAKAIAAVYAADADITQPGDHVRMRDGIQRMWQDQIARGLAACELTTTDADMAGDVITEKGAFVMKGKDGAVLSKGTYTNTWVREAGRWYVKTSVIVPAKA